MGSVSAAITAILTITGGTTQSGQAMSGADLALRWAAASLAFIAPFLALASSSWFD